MNTNSSGELSSNKDCIKKLFFIFMSAGFVCFLVTAVVTRGVSLNVLLFGDINPSLGGINPYQDEFMDLFNSISHSTGKIPYENAPISPANGPAIYPPFAYLIYKFLALLIPYDVLVSGSHAIRSSQMGLVILSFYISISSMALYFIIAHNKKGTGIEKFVFSLLISLSFPFVFQIERANIIFIALIFLMLFIYGKDSENKIIRELSLVCLAISAAIKIYPAVFGLLLVKERRFKETLRLVIYGVIGFFAPFFAFGGLRSISLFIESLSKLAEQFYKSFAYKVNFTNTVRLFFAAINKSSAWIDMAANILLIIIVVLIAISVFSIKSKWRVMTLLSLSTILIPSFSYFYTLIFMLPPLMFFLDTKEERKKIDYAYLVLFILLFIPLPIIEPLFSRFKVSQLLVVFEGSLVLALLVLLLFEGMISLLKMKNPKSEKSEKICRDFTNGAIQ